MVSIETAKLDPTKVFKRPVEVLKDKSLSREEKIDILRRWAYDEREMAVAEEENMRPNADTEQNNILQEILICLLELKSKDDHDSPPTKQG